MAIQKAPSSLRLRSPIPITIGTLASLYLVAFAADSLVSSLVKSAGVTFVFMPAAVAKAAMPFLIVTMALALAWIVLIRLSPSRPAATIVLFTGIILVMLYLPFLSFPLWLRQTPIGWLRYALWSMELGGYLAFYYMACSCVVIGMAGLLRQPAIPSEHGSTG